ncbi:facilitated trehalose transporter Tret1-like [Penaeus monodon]|uniref:facilitated trehalose transporter Tret1-like n=1 Tax=Penaeus monodon TaxID=6687 RepID=UPI0018A77547|nr:facilitated trehalose transporter Tret1-like [Penaeus monodon]
MVILPESPQWLTKKGKLEKATMSLEKPQNWKPVLIVFLVFMCGQFSGFAVVTAYTVDIFNQANTNIDSNTATIIVGFVRFMSTLVSAVLLDRAGRKPLLIISAIGSSVGMTSIGVFFYFDQEKSSENISSLVSISPPATSPFSASLNHEPSAFPSSIRRPWAGPYSSSLVYRVLNDCAALVLGSVQSSLAVDPSGRLLGSSAERGQTLEEIEKFFAPRRSESFSGETPLSKTPEPEP